MYKIGFLGLGKMGSAILNGILSKNLYKKDEISFYAPSDATQNKYTNLGLKLLNDEREVFINSKIIILAIKPQKYNEVFRNLSSIDFSDKVIISIAPGKSISYLESVFKNATIIRAMPNTPAFIAKATTTIAYNNGKAKGIAIDIFSSIGSYVIVDEDEIEPMIPLHGSMPAYILEFAKDFINQGVKEGILYDESYKLVLNSIIGSCELALSSNEDIDTLIDNVCSKGGSTIAGLNELRDNGFNEAIEKCYKACVRRGKELADS